MKKIIGQLIKEKLEACGMEKVAFAKAINAERSNVYDIFKRKRIDTNLLKKIGQVLEYDFFQDLLEPETIQRIVYKENIKKSKLLLEIELSQEYIEGLHLEEKIIKILKK